MGYSQFEDGDVMLIMRRDDYDFLLMLLGCATATQTFPCNAVLEFMNRINAGNPRYRPYVTTPTDRG